jgi:hypothetical protein
VQAANAGVSPDRAETLVRTLGSQPVADAVAIALGRQQRGKEIAERGGYIVRMAENLASGLWKLPAWLIKERDAAERKAERDHAAAQRVVTSPVPEGKQRTEPAPFRGLSRPDGSFTARSISPIIDLTTPLTTAERHALEQRALSEVLAAATPLTRPLIERRGIGHNHVQAHLRYLLAREPPPTNGGPP